MDLDCLLHSTTVPLMFEEFEILTPQTIYLSATPRDYEIQKSDAVVEQLVRPTGLVDPEIEVRPVSNQVDDLLSEIRIRTKGHERGFGHNTDQKNVGGSSGLLQ